MDPASVQPSESRLALAIRLHRSGLFGQARSLYVGILAADPRHFDALNLSGLLAAQTGEPAAAVEFFDRAIAVDPSHAAVFKHRGAALYHLGRMDAALASYDRAIMLDESLADAHFQRGIVSRKLGRPLEALHSYDRAVACRPGFAEAHYDRGNLLHELGRLPEAVCSFGEAIAANGEFADAHANRGAVFDELGEAESALADYDRAIAIDPRHAAAHANRGLLLQQFNRWDEALASCDRAIEIDAQLAQAYVNRAFVHLLRGDFARGFADYEWRWLDPAGMSGRERRTFREPLWLGRESLAGKRILLYGEQGLGDTLQFCRYAERVAQLGAAVILEVQPPLTCLLGGLAGVSQVIARGGPLPDFDYQCPLMSLPLAFGTRLDSVPSAARYLYPDPAKTAQWLAALGFKRRPRVGLQWSGSPVNRRDAARNVGLAELLAHLPPGFEYVSLQKEVRDADRSPLASASMIRDFAGSQQDFRDAAALCCCMDLIISVDTSMAHLSAALGRPTWILSPYSPDWRWLLDREDSPWYPTARVYRQQTRGDWRGVLRRVNADLMYRLGF